MKVLPGEIRPTSRPPVNQMGMLTSMPLPPSKSRAVTNMGSPTRMAAVSTAWTPTEIRAQGRLKPSCW